MTKQYQVLARKYRPKAFSELLGQTHVWQALANAIDGGRLHHAYLFTGTRGVGKTTIARILAKCLNCDTGVTSTPCGVCDTCRSIDAGRFLDLIEIDAASRTKVEDTRELLENVPYAPVQGRFKVYLIDEVHMLSTHSFNALLKTLEEPPEHAKFIFATTDPQKIPVTIISRCLQFVLRPLSQTLLADHLAHVLTAEQVAYFPEGLWQLAASAKGSVRDALSLTDQAIAFGGGKISTDTVSEMLGLVDESDVLQLLKDVYEDNRIAVGQTIERMRAKMVDATAILDSLIDAVHNLAIQQVLGEIPLDMNESRQAVFINLSDSISCDVLQLYYEILVKSRDGIRLASTPMQALEMGLLRLLAFQPLSIGTVVDTAIQSKPLPPQANNLNAATAASIAVDSESPTHKCVITHEVIQPETQSFAHHHEADHSDTDIISGDKSASNTNLTSSMDTDESLTLITALNDNLNASMGYDSKINAPNASDQTPIVAVPQNTDMPDASDDISQDPISQDLSVDLNKTNASHSALDTANNQDCERSSKARPNDKLMDNTADNSHIDATPAELSEPTIADTQLQLNKNAPKQLAATDDLSALPAERLTQSAMQIALQAPSVELTGEWTPAKWDYWLNQMRAVQLFDTDELALMDGAQMTGEIEGACQLIFSEDNQQVQTSFSHILDKIRNNFPKMQLLAKAVIANNVDHTPRHLRGEREAKIAMMAQKQLIESSVVDALWQHGFLYENGEPILLNSKLTLPLN